MPSDNVDPVVWQAVEQFVSDRIKLDSLERLSDVRIACDQYAESRRSLRALLPPPGLLARLAAVVSAAKKARNAHWYQTGFLPSAMCELDTALRALTDDDRAYLRRMGGES